MLKYKKSFIILKIVFSNLNEKKLKLIKYSKNLQNKLNVKFINYILYTGKYIIYENKKKVKNLAIKKN